MDQNIKEEISLGTQELLIKASQAFKGLPVWQRFVLVLFVVGTVPGYFAARSISQFGFEQSYKNYVLTARQLVINPKPVAVSETTALPLGENQYSVYALIENQNLDLSLSDARYVVELKNATNDTVGRSSGSYFLLPGEKRYLVVSRIPAQDLVRSATVTFSEERWQNRLSIPEAELVATDPIRFVQSDPLAYVVEGTLINNSPFTIKRAAINVLLFDGNDKIVAVSRREEFDIVSRSRRAYKLLWPGISGANIVRAEVQVDANTLDSSNLRVQNDQISPAELPDDR